jgi:hypothetical protein
VATDNFFAALGDMLMENVDASREGDSSVTSAAGEDLSMGEPPHNLTPETDLFRLQSQFTPHDSCDYDHKRLVEDVESTLCWLPLMKTCL